MNILRRRPVSTTCHLVSLALAVALGGCVDADIDPENDPAALLGDEEWLDDGPPAGEESLEVDELKLEVDPATAPAFQLPFPCNQVWAGQTRTNHSPQQSIDFNRTDDIG